jgi:NAD+ diphosphatase
MEISLFCGTDILLPPRYAPPSGDPSLDRETELPVLPEAELPKEFPLRREAPAVFRYGQGQYAAFDLEEGDVSGFQGFIRIPLRTFIGQASPRIAAFSLKAKAFAHWDTTYQFCASCGKPLSWGAGPEADGGKRCGTCGKVFFPKISPAIIVLVSRGDKMLLAHNAKFPPGRHGLIAGFVEAGETLEETVRREVMEEAGIEIEEPRYVSSQPWPFPDSLMLGFEAEYRSGEARPDGVEIDHLGWFSAGDLPTIPPPGSVARALIDRFLNSLAK